MSTTLFDHVGGSDFFFALVDRFYEGIEGDDVIRPLYPDDLEPGKRALALFLGQYFGGPTAYSDEKGHPRLRMRHFPFRIGEAQRAAWVRHMAAAVESAETDDQAKAAMNEYFVMAAGHLVNAEDE